MLYLVRYGELALKSERVRRRFEEALVSNIQDVFMRAGEACVVERERGRLFVEADAGENARAALSRVFGVVSFSPVVAEPPSEPGAVAAAVAEALAGRSFASFAVRARRSGQHTFTSRDMAIAVGDAVSARFPSCRVDLDAPELEIGVETRGPRTYVFIGRVRGPGGLPLGTQGVVLALARRGEDLAAAWMMMKRGCYANVMAPDPSLAEPLRAWDPGLKAHAGDVDDPAEVARVMEAARAQALVLPGKEFPAGRPYGSAPVFLPMLGLDDAGAAEIARRIASGSCL